MLETLKALLASTPGVSDWKLVEQRREGRELFFVGRELDMQRARSVRHLALTVYHDFEEDGKPYRGMMRTGLPAVASTAELARRLEEAVFAARQVRNEPFPLVEPGGASPTLPPSRFADGPLGRWLASLAGVVFDADPARGAGAPARSAAGRINSAELFLDQVETRIVNSRGVDVRFPGYEGYLELIVESEGPAGEVELYREIRFSDYQPELLEAEVRSELELVRDRAQAGATPRLRSASVMIGGEALRELMHYYLVQSAAESAYNGVSRFKVGDNLQGPTVRGDTLSIRGEAYLPGSTASAPWDGDGLPLQSTLLIEDGVVRRLWGPLRFCHYLGVQPTGGLGNFEVRPGERSLEELRREARLEVAAFSDFHGDPITGDFGGEVRLGYVNENGRRRPVSGGSVSGNLKELQGRMYLSQEVQQLNSFRGPRGALLFDVAVTGVR